MRTRVVIGYDGAGNAAKPHTLYIGESGSEAQAAMEASNAVGFEIFEGPGRWKNNSRHDPSKPVNGTVAPSKEPSKPRPSKAEAKRLADEEAKRLADEEA